jgi:GT2 family glycosyltransferase
VSVTVSVVSFASQALISDCLDAVRTQGAPVREVLIADNASKDGTVELVKSRHPEVSVLPLDRNLGYGAAHNLNFARSREKYFLALNPDVVLQPGFVARLVEILDGDSSLGAATGRLVTPGPEGRIDSAGLSYDRVRTRFTDRGRGELRERFAREEDVFGACGAAALYRRVALEEVSRPGEFPFAERFFMYYEDVDLAWRLGRAGWRTRYVPDAESVHLRGGCSSSSAFIEYHLVRNRLWLSLRNASLSDFLLELPGLALFEGVKLIQASVRPHLRAALIDQLAGVRQSLVERRRAAWGA